MSKIVDELMPRLLAEAYVEAFRCYHDKWENRPERWKEVNDILKVKIARCLSELKLESRKDDK